MQVETVAGLGDEWGFGLGGKGVLGGDEFC